MAELKYKRVLLYYFSGTGNSYRVATWISDYAHARGAEVSVIPIGRAKPRAELDNNTIMGIVMPTHGFTASWSIIKFLLKLPRKTGCHAFCLTTRAGLKFGNLLTPGIGGSATFIVSLLLFLKKYSVRGISGIDMPSNWLSLHSGLKTEDARVIIEFAHMKTHYFAERILRGDRIWFTPENKVELILGLVLLPISILYLLFSRIFLAKIFFANPRCTGCGICAQNCPKGAIKMWGKKRPLPYWTYKCESCMRCMAYCPLHAIEAGQGWLILLIFIVTIPVSTYLHINGTIPGFLLQITYYFVSAANLYLFLMLLTRIPGIRNILPWTTFTRVYRRYHEPDTSLKDLSGKS